MAAGRIYIYRITQKTPDRLSELNTSVPGNGVNVEPVRVRRIGRNPLIAQESSSHLRRLRSIRFPAGESKGGGGGEERSHD